MLWLNRGEDRLCYCLAALTTYVLCVFVTSTHRIETSLGTVISLGGKNLGISIFFRHKRLHTPNPHNNGEPSEYYFKNPGLRALAFTLCFALGFVHIFLKRCKTSPIMYYILSKNPISKYTWAQVLWVYIHVYLDIWCCR